MDLDYCEACATGKCLWICVKMRENKIFQFEACCAASDAPVDAVFAIIIGKLSAVLMIIPTSLLELLETILFKIP